MVVITDSIVPEPNTSATFHNDLQLRGLLKSGLTTKPDFILATLEEVAGRPMAATNWPDGALAWATAPPERQDRSPARRQGCCSLAKRGDDIFTQNERSFF